MTAVEQSTTECLEFQAPGPGAWNLDVVHIPRPATRIAQALISAAFMKGFRDTAARYGIPFAGIRHASVNGFTYSSVVPLDPDELDAREAAARETWETKRWRDDIERWDGEAKPASLRRHRALAAVDLEALADDELVAHVRASAENLSAMVMQHHTFNGPAMIPLGDFLAFATRATGLPIAPLLELFAGASPVSGGHCPELQDVLEAVRRDAAAQALLDERGADGELLARLRSDAVHPATAHALEEWLAVVGHRALDGFDVYHPCALERPNVLVAALRSALQRPPAADVTARLDTVRAAVPADELAEFDDRYREALLAYRIRDERGVYSDGTAFGILRRAMLGVGRRLTDRGVIDDPELAIDADLDELAALLAGAAEPRADELRARRRFRETHTIADAPPTLGDPPSAPFDFERLGPACARIALALMHTAGNMSPPASEHREVGLLRGVAANPGRHEGRARVVHGIDDLLDFEPGDVLVTITTAECFNLVLSMASAVVTDQGGLLSHAAILAREYGIPAVVGTGAATALIHDGDLVCVDGSAGEVTW